MPLPFAAGALPSVLLSNVASRSPASGQFFIYQILCSPDSRLRLWRAVSLDDVPGLEMSSFAQSTCRLPAFQVLPARSRVQAANILFF